MNAARARVRAERRCGQLLKETEFSKGNEQTKEFGGRMPRPPNPPKTLSEMNITKKQSSKWQKLADMPEKEFEEKVKLVVVRHNRYQTGTGGFFQDLWS